jgi:hypothetical protein
MKYREEQVVAVSGETVAACLGNHAKHNVRRTQGPRVLKPVIHAVTVT